MAKNENPYNERSYRDLLWLMTVFVACDENKNNYLERGEVNPFAGALMAASVSKGDKQDFDFLWDMIIATGAHFFLGKERPSRSEEEKLKEKERHSWRDSRTYDWIEYGVDPDDYEDEDEYEEALEEVKYAWREDYEDAFFDYGVDPELYDDEDEFLADLDEARYGWRDDYTREWFEYGVDPDDYEDEDDFLEDLVEAKYAWRDEHRFDANDLDPDDYETEEEYLEAAASEEESDEDDESDDRPIERNISLDALNIEIGKDLKPEDYDNEFELIKAATKLIRERAPEEDEYTDFEPEENDEDRDDEEPENDFDEDDDWDDEYLEYESDDDEEEWEDDFGDEFEDEDDNDDDWDDEEEPLDDEVYTFYGVRFPSGNTVYSYLADEDIYERGDEVIVPAGPNNEEKIAEIVSINQYPAYRAPYPPEKAKYIIRKAEPEDKV